MKTETKEVKEIVVLTDDQIKALPKVVKENVVFLTENMNPKDLVQLNPIVKELIEIRAEVNTLELKPKGEDGKYDKENIQTFVDAKKRIRTFNGDVGRAGKTLKEPYLAIQKGVVAIEKALKSESDACMKQAEETFAEYVEYEEKVKAEKERKKNEALLAKVSEANEEMEEVKLKSQRTDIYNRVKYNKINEYFVKNVADTILDGNQRKLEYLQDWVSSITYDSLIDGENIDILSVEVKAELQEFFASSKTTAIRLLNDKIDELKKNALQPTMPSQASQVPPPPVEQPVFNVGNGIGAHVNLNDEDFYKYVMGTIENLLNLTIQRIKQNPKCAPSIYDLRNKLSTF